MPKRLLPCLAWLLITVISACHPVGPDLRPVTATPPVTRTPAPTFTPTASEFPSEQCGWEWATQYLPELSAQVQTAMEGAGLKDLTVIAEAYGENCRAADGTVARFAAMETDFRVTINVASLDDRAVLGGLLETILIVLDGFPAESTPGPNPGYVSVTFQSGENALRLWFPILEGESARALGLSGAALLDMLQNR